MAKEELKENKQYGQGGKTQQSPAEEEYASVYIQ